MKKYLILILLNFLFYQLSFAITLEELNNSISLSDTGEVVVPTVDDDYDELILMDIFNSLATLLNHLINAFPIPAQTFTNVSNSTAIPISSILPYPSSISSVPSSIPIPISSIIPHSK